MKLFCNGGINEVYAFGTASHILGKMSGRRWFFKLSVYRVQKYEFRGEKGNVLKVNIIKTNLIHKCLIWMSQNKTNNIGEGV